MSADWVDLAFEAAVRWLSRKKPITRDAFDTMTLEARDVAFTASRVAKLEVLQDLLDQLNEAASSGMTLQEFIDAERQIGLTDAHLETIFRTNLQSAFGRGRFDQLTDPQISSAIWGWRYKTVGDDRVRPEHAVLDGSTFATGTHDEIFPPWDFNCRCSTEVITKGEARRQGIESDALPDEVQSALSETDFASPAIAANFTPNLSGYDVGLLGHYLNEGGAQ